MPAGEHVRWRLLLALQRALVGGAGAPGEKAWEILRISVVFCVRLAAAIGFLQMKRWGQQWLIVTCWRVLMWMGYNTT